jgi:hypothetical protein
VKHKRLYLAVSIVVILSLITFLFIYLIKYYQGEKAFSIEVENTRELFKESLNPGDLFPLNELTSSSCQRIDLNNKRVCIIDYGSRSYYVPLLSDWARQYSNIEFIFVTSDYSIQNNYTLSNTYTYDDSEGMLHKELKIPEMSLFIVMISEKGEILYKLVDFNLHYVWKDVEAQLKFLSEDNLNKMSMKEMTPIIGRKIAQAEFIDIEDKKISILDSLTGKYSIIFFYNTNFLKSSDLIPYVNLLKGIDNVNKLIVLDMLNEKWFNTGMSFAENYDVKVVKDYLNGLKLLPDNNEKEVMNLVSYIQDKAGDISFILDNNWEFSFMYTSGGCFFILTPEGILKDILPIVDKTELRYLKTYINKEL